MKSIIQLFLLLIVLILMACPPSDIDGEGPICDFDCLNRKVEVGEDVKLTDKSQFAESWEWTITPNHFQFVNGTDQYSSNPVVQFEFGGLYTVRMTVYNEFGEDTDTETDYIEVSKYSISWSQLPDMPVARGGFDPCILDGKIYLAGGTLIQGSQVDVFDPIANSYNLEGAGSLSTERLFCRNGVVDGRMYVAGGIRSSDLANYQTGDVFGGLNSIEYYDAETNNWQSNSFGLGNGKWAFSLFAEDDLMYVLGGCKVLPFKNDSHLTKFDVLDAQTDKWNPLTDMPEIQTFAGMEKVGDKLYVMGGEVPNTNHIGVFNINIFNVVSGIWEEVPDEFQLLRLTWGQGTCVVDDLILNIGGQSAFSTYYDVQIVDPNGLNTDFGTKLPYSSVGPGVCTYDGKIYVFGGAAALPSSTIYKTAYVGELTVHPSF